MQSLRTPIMTPLPMLPPLPGWIATRRGESMDAAAFRSGAALAYLTLVTASADLPQALWRDRLALAAAGSCVRLAGRREGARDLRDAVHLTKAGGDPGPAGQVLRQWSWAVAVTISATGLGRALEGVAAERIADCLGAPGQTPVHCAAQAIEATRDDRPEAETARLILADAVLSKALGQRHVLPLLSLSLTLRDLRLAGDDLRLACHRAVVGGAGQAMSVASELARGAARIRAVAPKLRARGAGRAVELFLSRDALAPAALNFMSDRAARRLCDRLVDLGAVRELTGRNSFRLYGV
jgi:hypothetical protein